MLLSYIHVMWILYAMPRVLCLLSCGLKQSMFYSSSRASFLNYWCIQHKKHTCNGFIQCSEVLLQCLQSLCRLRFCTFFHLTSMTLRQKYTCDDCLPLFFYTEKHLSRKIWVKICFVEDCHTRNSDMWPKSRQHKDDNQLPCSWTPYMTTK